MKNDLIRKAARWNGVTLWQIAQKLNVSEPTLTRWLRVPLSPEREQKIMDAIEAVKKERV